MLYFHNNKEGIMGRKMLMGVLGIIIISFCTASFAADQKVAVASPKKAAPAVAKPVPMPAKPNFGMIAGTVVNVDNTDPANVKLQVKNDADGSVRTVTVTPWTNITKVTDISELKSGEAVRMMTRKVDDKEMAMGIMFGKVKTPPPPAPKAPAVPKAPAAAAIKK